MNIKEFREKAIKRYKNDESPKEIYQSLGKSKTWFFKWLKRYKLDGKDWAKSHSCKPHKSPKRIDEMMEQMVIETRKHLEKKLYSQIGALAISYNLNRQGIISPPISTINKILRRNDLIHQKTKYIPKGVNYPSLVISQSNYLHQLDVVGPRYLKEDGRFYSINIIDAYDRRNSINPDRRQNRRAIIKALICSWHTLGLPCYLQMDNQLALRGSNHYPHSFGVVIRLCLYMGIQPLFIPLAEPWRNGIIEHFQNVFDKTFFRAQYFKGFSQLYEKAKEFEPFHNQNHNYSTLKGLTPNQKCSGDIKLLSTSFRLPEKLAISPGYIHLIRFIRSDGVLDIFGEKYIMPDDVEYEYVWATIDTAQEKLLVYHDSKLVVEHPYPLPKSSIDLSRFDL
jgi:transposase-like protein